MTARRKGAIVLAVQLLLVASIAAKYAWERHTCPMVWTRTTQFDPEQPLRGRYLALTLEASACGLRNGDSLEEFDFNGEGRVKTTTRRWDIYPIARNGILTGRVADKPSPEATEQLTLRSGRPCEFATLSGTTDFFISEHAKTPFPLEKEQELWALVTVPPSGPPRPVQLAIYDGKTFHPLDLR